MTNRPPMPREYLDYFQALIEIRPEAEPFGSWWQVHGEELRTYVSPGRHLRLRMGFAGRELRAILAEAAYQWREPPSLFDPKFYQPDPIPVSWLSDRIEASEMEASLPDHEYHRDLWRWLLQQMQAGDEVWEFCSPAGSWAAKCGAAGFAFVREGKVYDSVVTLRN